MSRILWCVQVLLACLFLFAGGMKLTLPDDQLIQLIPLNGTFLRFIGLCETLGAIGLILPSVLRIQPGLTPLAAAGLVVIMTGAVLLTPQLMGGEVLPALEPLVIGLLALFVAYGRARLAPLQPRARRSPVHAGSRA